MKTKLFFYLSFLLLAIFFNSCKKDSPIGPSVEKVAGTGVAGFSDGPVGTAQFNTPSDIAIDATGNLFIADAANDRVRKISTDGSVTTIAGSGERGYLDGSSNIAKFNSPGGIFLDTDNSIYLADWNNNVIRKISNGTVSTFAGSTPGFLDGPASQAKFYLPKDIIKDGTGNFYVTDHDNHRIRKISPGGVVSTIAGTGVEGFKNGSGSEAQFSKPRNIAIDNMGNLYIADAGNQRIRKITPDGMVSTFAGEGTRGFMDGPGNVAQFKDPKGLAIDKNNNIYIADQGNHRIRKITPDGNVTTFAGDGTIGSNERNESIPARFHNPRAITIDAANKYLYIVDQGNNMIRKIAL